MLDALGSQPLLYFLPGKRVDPGDWIGGPDGVIVVTQEIAMEALHKAKEIEPLE